MFAWCADILEQAELDGRVYAGDTGITIHRSSEQPTPHRQCFPSAGSAKEGPGGGGGGSPLGGSKTHCFLSRLAKLFRHRKAYCRRRCAQAALHSECMDRHRIGLSILVSTCKALEHRKPYCSRRSASEALHRGAFARGCKATPLTNTGLRPKGTAVPALYSVRRHVDPACVYLLQAGRLRGVKN
jgi:hypothetical protein